MSLSQGWVIHGKESIPFNMLYVDRKTLEIAVHPDRSVVIKAPVGTKMEEVQKRVGKRAGWITRQLNYFRQFDPRMPKRRYVGGETHLYLGRQYRLKIGNGKIETVKLIRGYLHIETGGKVSPGMVQRVLEVWYRDKALGWFNERFERCWPYFERFSLTKPRLQIRRMQKRWGSLSGNGALTLNTDLIRAPKECIDYVITHELCHLQFHDHGPGFYRFLEKVMPDWERRKQKLELVLV